MTVFVVQEVTGRNILSAEKFGKLELLLPEGSQLVLRQAHGRQCPIAVVRRRLMPCGMSPWCTLSGHPLQCPFPGGLST